MGLLSFHKVTLIIHSRTLHRTHWDIYRGGGRGEREGGGGRGERGEGGERERLLSISKHDVSTSTASIIKDYMCTACSTGSLSLT
jgi:hypothetical protein